MEAVSASLRMSLNVTGNRAKEALRGDDDNDGDNDNGDNDDNNDDDDTVDGSNGE